MHPDPITTWLDSVSSTFGRAMLFIASVLAGSAIPRMLNGTSPPDVVLAFPMDIFQVFDWWGPLSWLAWFALPAFGYCFYSLLYRETSKRDLFLTFSISLFFFSPCVRYVMGYLLQFVLYAIILLLYWKLPGWLYERNAHRE